MPAGSKLPPISRYPAIRTCTPSAIRPRAMLGMGSPCPALHRPPSKEALTWRGRSVPSSRAARLRRPSRTGISGASPPSAARPPWRISVSSSYGARRHGGCGAWFISAFCSAFAIAWPPWSTGSGRTSLTAVEYGSSRAARLRTGRNALQIRVDECRQLRLRHGADFGGHHLAVLEEHQRRDAAHVIPRGHRLILIDVDLGYIQPTRITVCRLIQRGRNHLARTTPLGPI